MKIHFAHQKEPLTEQPMQDWNNAIQQDDVDLVRIQHIVDQLQQENILKV